MPGVSITDQYDTLLTTTLRKYRKKMIDNIFYELRTLRWLMNQRSRGKQGSTFELAKGGYKIIEHLEYATNATFDWFDGYEAIDTTPQEIATVAEFSWRELGGSITISQKEELQNSGEGKMIDLLGSKVRNAEMSAKQKFSTGIFANLSADPAKAVTPLLLLANNSPSTTTCGGLAGATYAWWRNYQADVGAFTTQLIPKMQVAHNTLGKWGMIDGICCTQTAYEYYERLAGDGTIAHLRRITDEKKSLDLGFEILKYKGSDLWFDFDFATNTPVTGESMLFLNSRHIKLCMHEKANFKTTDFVRPHNQAARTALILAMGNLTINNRQALGLLHGIDAS